MSKSFDRGAAKKAGAKKGLPKGGGKGAKGYNLYTPVKQSTIDNIKKMGMTAALKKAGSSKNAEFVQGVKRMYGADRLKAAMKASNKVAKSPDAARASASKKAPARPVAKSPDEARLKATISKAKSQGGLRQDRPVSQQLRGNNTSSSKSKGLFPGLLTGNYKGKKITRGKVEGPGYFKS